MYDSFNIIVQRLMVKSILSDTFLHLSLQLYARSTQGAHLTMLRAHDFSKYTISLEQTYGNPAQYGQQPRILKC